MLVVTVSFVVSPGFEERFRERVVRQAAESLAHEPACRQFDVCVMPAEPRRLFLYEVYDDEAAFDVHLASPHFSAFNAETQGWVDEKRVDRWSLSRGLSRMDDPKS